MIRVYWVAFLAALVGAFIVAGKNRLQNVYQVFLTATIVVSNAGYLALALAQDLPTALLANKIAYVGCFIPFFLFMIVTDLCKIKVKRLPAVVLAACSLGILLMVFATGSSNLYYRSVGIRTVNGVTHLVREYGWGHIAYDSLLCFYAITIIGFLLYAFTRQTQISYKTILLLGGALLCGTGGYELSRFWTNDLTIDLIPVAYDVILYGLIITRTRINMYDMSRNVLAAWEHMEEYGYITFDTYGNYMGCNTLARKYFEKLEECKIDFPIENSGDEKLDELVAWLGSYQRNVAEDMKTCAIHDRVFRFNIRELTEHGLQIGYLIEFFDVTQEQKYIDMIEHYNADLEQEVDSKIAHISYIKDMMVLGMASMVENRDNSTGGHIRRTTEVVAVFAHRLMEKAEEFHVTKEFLNSVIKAAPMHDLGKIAINDNILRKQGDYIEKEYEEMKLHAAEGARIVDVILYGVEDDEFVKIAKNMAHYHHEKWNGQGYPDKLVGEQIPLEARIMALADVFDALVSKRCYKDAFSYDQTFEMIENSLGEQFDPKLGREFLECRPQLEELYEKWKAAELKRAE